MNDCRKVIIKAGCLSQKIFSAAQFIAAGKKYK